VSVSGDRSIKPDTKKEAESAIITSNSGTVGVQFSHELVNFSGDVKVPIATPKEKISVASTLHVKPHPNASIGLKVDYVHGGDLKGEGKLVGGTDKLEGGLSLTYPEKVIGGSVWHSLCSHFQWAASASHPLGTAQDPTTVVNVAGNFKLDDCTTLKARLTAGIDQSGKAEDIVSVRGAASVQQKVNLNTTVTVGADVNFSQAFGVGKGGDASAYGFQVSFK